MLRPCIPFAVAVLLVGCGDTPTVPEADVGPPLIIAATSDAVEEYDLTAGFALNDPVSGLWSTFEFDRDGWCAGGGGSDHTPWLGTVHVTKIQPTDEPVLFRTTAEGIVQVGEGKWNDCDDPLLAEGEGTLLRVNVVGKLITVSWGGTVTTDAGTIHGVSVQRNSKINPAGEGEIEISPDFGGA